MSEEFCMTKQYLYVASSRVDVMFRYRSNLLKRDFEWNLENFICKNAVYITIAG